MDIKPNRHTRIIDSLRSVVLENTHFNTMDSNTYRYYKKDHEDYQWLRNESDEFFFFET